MSVAIEQWPLTLPFRISGHVWHHVDLVIVSLQNGELVGRGEAAGVYYHGDTPEMLVARIEAVRAEVEAGTDRLSAQRLLPPGGARNALDSALWDLEAKLSGVDAWQRAGCTDPRPVRTTFTCGAEAPEIMAKTALRYDQARSIKLKLVGDDLDADRVKAVRAARPDVWLSVDANQGFDRRKLEALMPVFEQADIRMIEQPFPVGQDKLLDGFRSPIPIGADESVQCLDDIQAMVGRYDLINIKLDKCGGLTEGLAMAKVARSHGLDVMVGNMIGTSLAMAPAWVLGQSCDIADLDGPLFLRSDRDPCATYRDGAIDCPAALWGSAR
nr:dipeptide epimerase [Sphingomonas sp. Y57]